MKNKEYLIRHYEKADKILRKVAMPYGRSKFAYVKNVNLVNEDNSTCGFYKSNEKSININKSHFKFTYKRKYEKKLIETIMHELLHAYINVFITDKTDKSEGINIDFSNDSNPIFLGMIRWFNNQLKGRYIIDCNRNLSRDLEIFQPDFCKSIDKINNFDELLYYFYNYKEEYINLLKTYDKEFKERNRKNNLLETNVYISDYENISDSFCIVNEIFFENKNKIVHLNSIHLGTDFNPYNKKEAYGILDFITCDDGIEDGGRWYEDYIIVDKNGKFTHMKYDDYLKQI